MKQSLCIFYCSEFSISMYLTDIFLFSVFAFSFFMCSSIQKRNWSTEDSDHSFGKLYPTLSSTVAFLGNDKEPRRWALLWYTHNLCSICLVGAHCFWKFEASTAPCWGMGKSWFWSLSCFDLKHIWPLGPIFGYEMGP